MNAQNGSRIYRAYLLRCWQEEQSNPRFPGSWRFSLEEISDRRQRTGFVSLEALTEYLHAQIEDEEES